jgi:hypothetical protein
MAYPRLYKKNYVQTGDTITVSSGDGTKAYLYDRINSTQWVSSGEIAGSPTIEVIFYELGATINRVIDRLILLNTNAKDFTLEAYYGAAWHTELTVAGNTSTTYVGTFASVTASKVRLTITATIAGGDEKAIGEMIVTEYRTILTNLLIGHNRQDDEKAGNYRLSDGTQETWFEYSKFHITQTLRNVETTLLGVLKLLKEEHTAFYIAPNTDVWVDEYYLVNWNGSWAEVYDPKTGYYEIKFDVSEE